VTGLEHDPLWEIRRNDPCWCGSRQKYKCCHGHKLPRSQPGAEIPSETGELTYISPTTRVALGAFDGSGIGAPMYMPSDKPEQRPLSVPAEAIKWAAIPRRQPVVSLGELGRLRFEILDGLGLTEPNAVAARVSALPDSDRDDLRYGILDLTKTTIDTLHHQQGLSEPATAIWVDTDRVDHMVGSTMLWADHYLYPDPLADVVLGKRSDLAGALLTTIRLRPLIEAGIVVPISRSVAVVAAGRAAIDQTARDLENQQLVEWMMKQLIIEGPTAKECLLYEIADDYSDLASFFFLSRMVDYDDAQRTARSIGLQHYRADFDYSPWIEQTKRQTIAKTVQDLNIESAIATSLGAEYVARTPFRARFLEKRGRAPTNSQHLVWARIPRLSNSSPSALADAVSTSDAVEALRHRVRVSYQEMRGKTFAERRQIAADLRSELQHNADVLETQMRMDRRWEVLVPTSALLTTVTLGAIGGAPLLATVSGLLAAAAGLGPRVAKRQQVRFQPAYAIVLGDGSVPPRPVSRTGLELQDFGVAGGDMIDEPDGTKET